MIVHVVTSTNSIKNSKPAILRTLKNITHKDPECHLPRRTHAPVNQTTPQNYIPTKTSNPAHCSNPHKNLSLPAQAYSQHANPTPPRQAHTAKFPLGRLIPLSGYRKEPLIRDNTKLQKPAPPPPKLRETPLGITPQHVYATIITLTKTPPSPHPPYGCGRRGQIQEFTSAGPRKNADGSGRRPRARRTPGEPPAYGSTRKRERT